MDKVKTYSLLSNAVLFIMLLILLRFCGCEHGSAPCAEVGRTSDTVTRYVARTDTAYRNFKVYVPLVREVRKGNQEIGNTGDQGNTFSTGDQENRKSGIQGNAFDRHSSAVPDFLYSRLPDLLCTDTVAYSDSIYQTKHFKAVIDDLISGNKIISRRISWADLTPITERVVTNTITVERRQPLIKVYLGADASVRYASPLSRGGIDITPATSIVFSDRYMVDLGYYILGGELSMGMKVKLGFGRK